MKRNERAKCWFFLQQCKHSNHSGGTREKNKCLWFDTMSKYNNTRKKQRKYKTTFMFSSFFPLKGKTHEEILTSTILWPSFSHIYCCNLHFTCAKIIQQQPIRCGSSRNKETTRFPWHKTDRSALPRQNKSPRSSSYSVYFTCRNVEKYIVWINM